MRFLSGLPARWAAASLPREQEAKKWRRASRPSDLSCHALCEGAFGGLIVSSPPSANGAPPKRKSTVKSTRARGLSNEARRISSGKGEAFLVSRVILFLVSCVISARGQANSSTRRRAERLSVVAKVAVARAPVEGASRGRLTRASRHSRRRRPSGRAPDRAELSRIRRVRGAACAEVSRPRGV